MEAAGAITGVGNTQNDRKHAFEWHTYAKWSYCGVCSKLMWGFHRQGLKCKECGLDVHDHCVRLVPKCLGADVVANMGNLRDRKAAAIQTLRSQEFRDVAVTIVSAANLAKKQMFHTPDPFAVLDVDGKITETPPCIRTHSPVWNFKQIVAIKEDSTIIIHIYDNKKKINGGKDDGFLGMVAVPFTAFSQMSLQSGATIAFRLKKRTANDTVTGMVVLKMKYTGTAKKQATGLERIVKSQIITTGRRNRHVSMSGLGDSLSKEDEDPRTPRDDINVHHLTVVDENVIDEHLEADALDMDDQEYAISLSKLGTSPGARSYINPDFEVRLRDIAAEQDVNLPAGWKEEVDDTGRTYYANPKNRESSYTVPTTELKTRTYKSHRPEILAQAAKAGEEKLTHEHMPDSALRGQHSRQGSLSSIDARELQGPSHLVPMVLPAPEAKTLEGDGIVVRWLHPHFVGEENGKAKDVVTPQMQNLEYTVYVWQENELESDLDIVYKGQDTEHLIKGLVPERPYQFVVSVKNNYGVSDLSPPCTQVVAPKRKSRKEKEAEKRAAQAEHDNRPHCPFMMAGFCRYGNRCRYSHGAGLQTEDDVMVALMAASLNEDPNAGYAAAIAASLMDQQKRKAPINAEHMSTFQRHLHKKVSRFRKDLPRKKGEVHITIDRENVVESSLKQLTETSTKELRKRLFIHFSNEGGLDYGGLAREWLYLLSQELFTPFYGLFEYSKSDNYTLEINPNSILNKDCVPYFTFIGWILGICILHGQFIDAAFVKPLYKRMLGKPIELADLQNVDPSFHSSLLWILDNSIEGVLELTFSVDADQFGEVDTVDLVPNGRSIPVTDQNKAEFVSRVVQWRATRNTEKQFDAMMTGLKRFVPPDSLTSFDEKELEILLCGLRKYDLDDWKKHTEYKGFEPEDAIVKWLWELLEEFGRDEQGRFLQFVTGTSRVPLEGFQALAGSDDRQKFCIQKLEGATDRLPGSHTCFNRFDLPEYGSKEELKEKLGKAMDGFEGFVDE
eukprot:Clim_evm67s144 gene=Clim_evmTU67s144